MYRFFRRNREKLLKYLLIFFLSIVSIGMVITLAPIPGGDTDRTPTNVLATLGGVSITTQDVQRRLEQQFRSAQIPNPGVLMAQFAPNTLDEMILEQALVVEAQRMGLEVSDQELADGIQALPYLKNNGSFVGLEQYQNAIEQATGMSVGQFETAFRDSLLTDKLRGVITDGVQAPAAEVHQEFIRRNEKAKIDYVLFNPSDFVKDVQVTPPALAAFFATNKQHYQLPERRQLRYVLIDPDHVRPLVKITGDELRNYYAQHLDQYRVPDRVKVAQILFKTAGKSPAEVAKLRQTAEDVLAQLGKGADFADMAKKYSQDTTASNGGDLGWLVRGQADFEDTAFALGAGQVSGLLTTASGIHIIKVFDRQTAHVQSFDEVKDSIQATLEKQKLQDAQTSLADHLQRALQADPQHFGEVVQKFGLSVDETPPFKYHQPIPNLGNSEGLENLAFQLTSGEVGQPVTLAKGVVIVELAKVLPAQVPALDEVRPQVEQDYRTQQSHVLAEEKAKEYASRVKSEDFKKAAQSLGLTVKESKDFTRQDTVENLISASELGDAFTLKPGQASGVVTVGSNTIVFRVVSQTPADESTFAAQQDQIRQQLVDQKKSLAFEIYRKNLKQELQRQGKLKINQDALKQFVAGFTGS